MIHPRCPKVLPVAAFVFCSGIQIILAGAGDPDSGFNPTFGVNDQPNVVVVQPDEKILLGGQLTSVNGTPFRGLARVDRNGTVDATFNPVLYTLSGSVQSIALQSDLKIIIGGNLSSGGSIVSNLTRINVDGALDTSFNHPDVMAVACVAAQPNGGIILAGGYNYVDGVNVGNFARVFTNGAVDWPFSTNTLSAPVHALAIQADGKIIEVGDGGIARHNTDGSLDPDFYPPTFSTAAFCVALQADSKILVGGHFVTINGTNWQYLARLNTDGTLDTSFHPLLNFDAYGIVPQTDGRIIVVGGFGIINGVTRTRIARLYSDGSLDTSLSNNIPGAGAVGSVALQSDGKLLIAGGFSTINGVLHAKVARLLNDPATEFLYAADGTRVRWMRGGSSPETVRVTFDLSTDGGTNWSGLGVGSRVAGGWELNGLSLPANGLIRARGRTSGGGYAYGGASGCSFGFVEAVASFPIELPVLSAQPGTGTVTLSWSTNSAGFIVQANPLLSDPNGWSDLTNVPITAGVNFSLAIPATNASRFFRLRSP